MKTSRCKVAKGIYIAYSLTVDSGEYTISCIEENKLENRTCFYRVNSITPSKRKAEKIYRLIKKHKAFGETLLDTIENLIVES